jgi:hypothetical protein
MNKKGQTLFLSILIGVMLFIFGMLFLNYIKPEVSSSKLIGLDCTNPSISDGNKVTCLGVDLVMPSLIFSIVSLAIGSILGRFIFS